MTNPKSIGIIGGAGPMASALMLHYIVSICQQQFGCHDDEDFPKILLLNVPFKPMLTPETALNNDAIITQQLKEAIAFLKPHCALMSIACNTLHAFIENDRPSELMDMIAVTKVMLDKQQISHPLILGTSTSMKRQVHQFRGAIYPCEKVQARVDTLIDRILIGDCSPKSQMLLTSIIHACKKEDKSIDAVVLACTELSVLIQQEISIDLTIIDPLKIAAIGLCEQAFMEAS